jgi:hypothetical protein
MMCYEEKIQGTLESSMGQADGSQEVWAATL